MKTSHAYLKGGADHLVCADYALAGASGDFAYAIVCDGQGRDGIQDIDFGVRALAYAARETVRLCRTTPLLPAFFGTYTIGKASAIHAIFPAVHRMALDASLLVAWVSGDKLTAYIYGNGTLIHKNHNHVRVVHANLPEPDFLSYHQDEVRKTSYLTEHRTEAKAYYDCIIQNGNESGSQMPVKHLEPVVIESVVQPGDIIYLCSDGIDGFRDKHQGLRDWREMLNAYTQGQLSLVMNDSFAEDDVSMATIAV